MPSSNKMKWTVLVSTVLCWVTVAYGDEEIVELPIYLRNFTEILLEQKSCVEEIISLAGNDLTDRFDTFSLAAYCAKKSRWTRNSGTRRLSDSVGNSIHRGRLTRRQTDWLYQLQNCAKPDCLDCWNISNCQIRNKRQSEKLSSLKFSEINSRIRNSQRGGNRVIRKEYRRLTDEERHKFHSAMNQLKTDLIDEMSKFDLFAVFHTPEQSPGAHFGAAFLPWHRELLKQ